MAQSFRTIIKGIRLKGVTVDPSDNIEGSVWTNSTDNELKAYLDSAVRTMVSEDQSQTLTNKTIDADNNTISNLAHGAEVDNPTSGVHGVTGDIVGTTDTQTLTNKTIDADLNTITNIENGDVKAAAGIEVSKLETLTVDRALQTSASGVIEPSTVTSTELGYLSGVTSDIQTQLDGKANVNLGNLGTTSINQDLLPDADSTRSLGSGARTWLQLFSLNIGSVSDPVSFAFNQIINLATGGTTTGSLESNGDVPSGTSGIPTFSSNSGYDLGIHTLNNTSANATPTDNVLIETGNKTAGTGDSGDISLQTGTSAGGDRGRVTIDAQAVRLPTAASDPSGANLAQGDVYYNTTNDKLKRYDGTVWSNIGGSGSSSGAGINLETDPFFQNNEGNWTGGTEDPIVDFSNNTFAGTLTEDALDDDIYGTDNSGNLRVQYTGVAGQYIKRTYDIPQKIQDDGYFYGSLVIGGASSLANGDLELYVYDVTNSEQLDVLGLVNNDIPAKDANGTINVTYRVPLNATTAQIRVALYKPNPVSTDIRITNIINGDSVLLDTPQQVAPVIIDNDTVSPTVDYDPQNVVQSVVRNAESDYTINFKPGAFDETPAATVNWNRSLTDNQRYTVGAWVSSIDSNSMRVIFSFMDDSGGSEVSTDETGKLHISLAGGRSSALVSQSAAKNLTASLTASLASDQTIPSGSTTTLDLSNALTNKGGFVYDTGNDRWEVPEAGRYHCIANIRFDTAADPWDAGDDLQIFLRKVSPDGTFEQIANIKPQAQATTEPRSIDISGYFDCQKGDFIRVSTRQDSGGNIDALSYDGTNFLTSLFIQRIPDFTTYAFSGSPNEVQTRILTANVTVDGVVSDLTFTGLEVGALYRVSGQVVTQITTTDDVILSRILHNGVIICAQSVQEDSPGTISYQSNPVNSIFLATTTTLTLNASSASVGSNIQGDGTRERTFLQLEKLNNYREV